MKRFEIHETSVYKIFDNHKQQYWEICFNDANWEDLALCREECDRMNQLFENGLEIERKRLKTKKPR